MGLWLGRRRGAAAAVSPADVRSFAGTFRAHVILMDLPYDRDEVFVLTARFREERDRNGGQPRLVALTKHVREHRESEAIAAGFDAQVVEPVDPELFERRLVGLLRPRGN